MENRFLIVNGHPDPSARRYCAALCNAYAVGVQSCGWTADRLDAGNISASLPRHLQETAKPSSAAGVLDRVRAADLVAIVFPLWLGSAPHALQRLFESLADSVDWPIPTIAAHLVVTMDMPALLYRPHSGRQKAPETRNQFTLQGVRACKTTLIGGVNVISQEDRQRRLVEIQATAASAIQRAMSARRRSVFGWRLPALLRIRPPKPFSRHVAGTVPQH